MTLSSFARRLVRAYRAQLTKEDLARLEKQFSALDSRLGVVRSVAVARTDPLEALWRVPAADG